MRRAIPVKVTPKSVRTYVTAYLLGVGLLLGGVGCSGPPTTTARTCAAKAQLNGSLDTLREFNYTDPDLSALAVQLDSVRDGLQGVEGAVHLRENSRLRQLGGVGRIRQLVNQIDAQVEALHAQKNPALSNAALERNIQRQAAGAQQIADAVTGC